MFHSTEHFCAIFIFFMLFFSTTIQVSNLKKVLERVIDFYEVHLDQRLTGFATPDVTKIGEPSVCICGMMDCP